MQASPDQTDREASAALPPAEVGPDAPSLRPGPVAMALLSLLLAIVAAYGGILQAPFLPDDEAAVQGNPSIQDPTDLARILSTDGASGMVRSRPLVNLSLALTLAADGSLLAYRLTNLLIHVAVAWALLGALCMTFSLTSMPGWLVRHRLAAAWSIALVWSLHPINMTPVVSVVQRAESMMALCFILGLWFAGLSAISRSAGSCRAWAAAAIGVLALGAGTKEVIVTAPVVIILWEMVYIFGGWREALRRRGGFYLGLMATWIPLLFIVFGPWGRARNVGAGEGNNAWQYLLAQGEAILTYLRLMVWPDPLIADYGPTPDYPLGVGLTLGAIVLVLLAGTFWLLARRPRLGFPLLMFFVVLAPTSTIQPLFTTVAEVRMYLPSAGLITLAMLGVFGLSRPVARHLFAPSTFQKQPQRSTARVAVTLAILWAGGLGVVTSMRTDVFQSDLALWADVVAKRPGNYRAHANLGSNLDFIGRPDAAIASYERALALFEPDPMLHYAMAKSLFVLGDHQEAIRRATRAIELSPEYAQAYVQRALSREAIGDVEGAIADADRAAELAPDNPEVLTRRAELTRRRGDLPGAIELLNSVIESHPGYASAYLQRGLALELSDQPEAAMEDYSSALEINPQSAEAFFRRGGLLRALGQPMAALNDYNRSLAINPRAVQAMVNRGIVLTGMGQSDRALADFQRAISIQPDYLQAYIGQITVYASLGRMQDVHRTLALARRNQVAIPPEVYAALGIEPEG